MFVPKGVLARTLMAISERGLDDAGNIRGFLARHGNGAAAEALAVA